MITYTFKATFNLQHPSFSLHPFVTELHGIGGIMVSEGFRKYEKCFDQYTNILMHEVNLINDLNTVEHIIVHVTNPSIYPKSTTDASVKFAQGELIRSYIILAEDEIPSEETVDAILTVSMFCQKLEFHPNIN